MENNSPSTISNVVDDEKNILGLEDTDYLLITKPGKEDKWRLDFDNAIENCFVNHFHLLLDVNFMHVEGKTIAVIKVKHSTKGVWTKNEKSSSVLYIRRTASTVELEGNEAMDYIEERRKHR